MLYTSVPAAESTAIQAMISQLCPFVLTLSLVGCAATASDRTPVYYDIGEVHRPVSTESAEAQLWFDRGLALCFGFNHEEAIACFQKATQIDPGFAMAYWGIAYALGPNYNNPEMSEAAWQQSFAALIQAERWQDRCTPVERGLIAATLVRQPSGTPQDRAPLDQAYAEAMRQLYRAFPDDADVAALTAEALMMLRPWKLWSPEGEPAPETAEIRAVLEPALQRWPNHPALCHLYIHTMEAGPEVGLATPAAERLEDLTPGIGHLVHMPSHIYIWTGRYQDAVRVNQVAVAKDRAYVEHAGRLNFYTLYRLHNYHFVAYGGMWSGQRAIAMEAARQIEQEIPAPLLQDAADFVEIFLATPLHVMVRFGMWEEILAEPEPAAELLGPRAVWRYARGVAYASLGKVAEAEREQTLFLEAKAQVPESRLLFNNSVADVLAVAQEVLAGEIAYRRGDHEEAFRLLRKAADLDKALNYDEPWGWMEPANHALGALLTEQGRYQEAEAVYLADLQRFPENGWSLHGLAECLQQTGRPQEAQRVRKRFDEAFSRADIEIPGSCFCRTE